MAILFSLLWYSYPPEMSARIIDTIIIGIISNILRLLFQNRLRIPHSDRHPLGTEHGTVIQSVAKNNDPVIGYIIPLHNFKNAPLFVDRFYKHCSFRKPHMGQRVQRNIFYFPFGAGDKNFVNLLLPAVIVTAVYHRLIVTVCYMLKVVIVLCFPPLFIFRRHRPGMFFPVDFTK